MAHSNSKLWLGTSKVKNIPWKGCKETGGMWGPQSCLIASLHTSALTGKLWVSLIELFLPSTPRRVRGLIALDWNITVFVLLLPTGTLSMQRCCVHTAQRSPPALRARWEQLQTSQPWVSIEHPIYGFENQHWPSEILMLIAIAFHCLS